VSRHRNRRRQGREAPPSTPSPTQAQIPAGQPPPGDVPGFLRRPWLFVGTAIVLVLWLAYLLILYFATVRPMQR
jgi:hypothetical protein